MREKNFCLWQNIFQKGVFRAERVVKFLTPGFNSSPGKNETDCLAYSAGRAPRTPRGSSKEKNKTKFFFACRIEKKKGGWGGAGGQIRICRV